MELLTCFPGGSETSVHLGPLPQLYEMAHSSLLPLALSVELNCLWGSLLVFKESLRCSWNTTEMGFLSPLG